MNSKDLKNMDDAKLLTMQNQIKNEIESRISKVDLLFKESKEQLKLAKRHDEEKTSLNKKQIIIVDLKVMGYDVVDHGNSISILDFYKNKINDKFIGFSLQKDGTLTNQWDKILDKDFQKVKQILGIIQ